MPTVLRPLESAIARLAVADHAGAAVGGLEEEDLAELVATTIHQESQGVVAGPARGATHRFFKPGQLLASAARPVDAVNLVDLGKAGADKNGLTVGAPVQQTGRTHVLVATQLFANLLGNFGDALEDDVAGIGGALLDLCGAGLRQKKQRDCCEQH